MQNGDGEGDVDGDGDGDGEPPFFTLLPIELVLEIIPRVPRRYHPILSCVSKFFANLVPLPEIQEKRSLLGLDSVYICFAEKPNRYRLPNSYWYILRRIENDPTQNHFFSFGFPLRSILDSFSAIAVGPEIFFVTGTNVPSSTFVIFDSRSGQFRRGPDMLVNRLSNSVGFVGEKIYVIGGNRDVDIEVECFDLKKKIWEVALSPEFEGSWCCAANVSFERKVCALSLIDDMTCYDTGDGSCERFEMPWDKWWRTGVCVIENVMYVYFRRFGLMWFDAVLKLWRIVDGLSDLENLQSFGWGIVDGLSGFNKVRAVGMAEYYGKMAFFWKGYVLGGETKDIWCRMIGLVRSEGGVRGTAEPPQLLGTVPRSYRLQCCLSVSD